MAAGAFQLGSAMPGPHQSRSELYSFHNCQILRECSVNRFSLGKPMSSPKRVAPSPTSITCPVCSITVLAREATFLMSCTAPTEPALRVGPCMQQESNSTTQSSLGRPPNPTLSSLGSFSGPETT